LPFTAGASGFFIPGRVQASGDKSLIACGGSKTVSIAVQTSPTDCPCSSAGTVCVEINSIPADGTRGVAVATRDGKGVADVFEKTAKDLGMTVVGHEGIDPKAADYKALMTKISTSNAGGPPDGIFVGMVVDNNASQLLKDKVSIMGDNSTVKYMGPDGIQTQAFIDGAGADVAEGVYGSVAGLAPENYTDAGKKFLSDYEAKYGKLTEPYAIYGYEAMNVLLKAIEDVCASGGDPTDRAAVTKAVFAIKDFDGVLGKWSFDENGDTTLTSMTIYQVTGGAYKAVDTVQ